MVNRTRELPYKDLCSAAATATACSTAQGSRGRARRGRGRRGAGGGLCAAATALGDIAAASVAGLHYLPAALGWGQAG